MNVPFTIVMQIQWCEYKEYDDDSEVESHHAFACEFADKMKRI